MASGESEVGPAEAALRGGAHGSQSLLQEVGGVPGTARGGFGF